MEEKEAVIAKETEKESTEDTTEAEDSLPQDEENEEVETEEVEEDDVEFDDDEEIEEETPKKQSKKTNHEYAKMRREREEQLAKDNYNKGIKDAIGGVNPYTNEPIEDDFDLEVYKNMKEAEKLGYEPVEEYHKFLKDKNKKAIEESEKKKKEETESNEKATKDLSEFKKSYPKVDVNKLLSDEMFLDYAEGKLGSKPLKDIYDGFKKYKDRLNSQAEKIAKSAIAKKEAASVGSRTEASGSSSASNTDIGSMSDAEFKIWWEKHYGK